MSRPPRTTFPDPVLIADTESLRAACERLRGEQFVTVDTEFMRERTYWPILCVGGSWPARTRCSWWTPRPRGSNLTPIDALMADPAVTKVFHAARQDLEIFLHIFGRLPAPLFDTQVAAMVAGFGDQVGYDSLVSSLTGGQIDKAHRFSDWSARPLSAAQVTYAAADVTWLRQGL